MFTKSEKNNLITQIIDIICGINKIAVTRKTNYITYKRTHGVIDLKSITLDKNVKTNPILTQEPINFNILNEIALRQVAINIKKDYEECIIEYIRILRRNDYSISSIYALNRLGETPSQIKLKFYNIY